MKSNIWIFCLEPIENRYTKQWYDNIPKLLKQKTNEFEIIQIDGDKIENNTTSGAFLNFSETNYWKSSQLCNFINYFRNNKTTKKDKFLFTDFWNPIIIQIKYMNDLLDQEWELSTIVHAGAYDPTDILGMKMSKPWPYDFERSIFNASDYNYFGTNFHRNMFIENLKINSGQNKAIRSGQPHNEIIRFFDEFNKERQDYLNSYIRPLNVIWPHRYNEDKQPDIAEDINLTIPISFTQKMNLSKEDYYYELSQHKVLFSCSKHENLGISVMEGVLAGCIPIVPDRSSYKEMYLKCFRYPSYWTHDYESYLKNKDNLLDFISERIVNYNSYYDVLQKQKKILIDNYLTSNIMLDKLVERK